jgi:hypothetical protein
MKITMKNITCFFLCFFATITLIAQNGPAGIGNSSNIEVWLDASELTLNNNDPVNSWTDLSGNSNNAIQSTSTNQPLYRTSQINGRAAVQFDGTNDFLTFSSNITNGSITLFAVYLSNKISQGSLLNTQKHFILTKNNVISTLYRSPNTRYEISKLNGAFSIFCLQTDGTNTGVPLDLWNGSTTQNFTRNALSTAATSRIGNFLNLVYFEGRFAELVIYNEELISARRKIVSNHLAAKYNLDAELNLFSFKSNFGNEVIGIGQEADGSHTTARGDDSLQISNPSSLSNSEYLLIGNNGSGFGTNNNVPSGVAERWDREWRVDITGSPGTIDLEFFLGSNGFAPTSDYVLLLETDDGDFGNGGTSIDPASPIYDPVANSITFSNVNLPDGAIFTLAESTGVIAAVRNGNWNALSTWNCTCIPSLGSKVDIPAPFNVIVDANSFSGELTIESGATLSFSGNDTLFIDGSVVFEDPLVFNSGTFADVTSSTVNSFINNSVGLISFNNFYQNNALGTNFISGDWELKGDLRVSNGGMDVSGVNSFTLVSNSSSTSQILESMPNAFTGDFIVERFIGPRNANFANMTSPILGATVADWDDDLFLSGVGGADGNATALGGGIFYSVYSYNRSLEKHDTITSITTPLIPGQGYEVWLADNLTTFNGRIVDYEGLPVSGNVSNVLVDQGWNLIGNPYHSFIQYDSIRTSIWVPNSFYIFNTNSGTYDFFSGAGKPPIAASQGFWIRKITFGTKAVDFKESAKVSSNSSAFLRTSNKKDYSTFKISSTNMPFYHQAVIDFDVHSTDKVDENDGYYLPSPVKKAPAIYSKASNSNEGLIFNSLSPLERSQVVPISIYAGEAGDYKMSVENIEAIHNNYNCVYLLDKKEENIIDLNFIEEYEFTSETGTSNRFNLILSNSYDECQKLIDDPQTNQKLDNAFSLRNSQGQWYLDYTLSENQNRVEILVFNMSGQQVTKIISFSASNAGTYPLENLRELEGMFVIQVKSNEGLLNRTVNLQNF